MARLKRKVIIGAAAVLCISFSACGNKQAGSSSPASSSQVLSSEKSENENIEFTSKSGTYSISVPDVEGGWTQTVSGNDYNIVIDNSNQTLTVLVHGYSKEQSLSTYPNLDSLVNTYESTMLAGTDKTEEDDVPVSIAKNVITHAYKLKQEDGTTAMASVSYIETENYYYVYTITGLQEVYDADIKVQKAAVTNLKEI